VTDVDTIQRYTRLRFQSAEQSLRTELSHLQSSLVRALRTLDAGEPCDEHLIQNASGIATLIARRNAMLEIRQLLGERE